MILTTDEARALRALKVSGRRLLPIESEWRVHARGDARTRPLARLDHASAMHLLAARRLRPASHGGLVLTTASHIEEEGAAVSPTAPDRAFLIAGTPRPGHKPGFAGLARKAEAGLGPLSRRAAHAGLILIKDAEAATRQSGLAPDYTAPPRDRDARRTWRGGGVDAGARARASVRRVKEKIDPLSFNVCWQACVEARSLKGLAATFGFHRRDAPEKLAAALEALADGYGI